MLLIIFINHKVVDNALLERYMLSPSVCRPSVCLSVTSRSSTKMDKHRNAETTPDDSFLMPKILAKLHWGHPQTGPTGQHDIP